MPLIERATLDTEIGPIVVAAEGDRIVSLRIERRPMRPESAHHHSAISSAIDQLREYFSGARTDFTVPFTTQGTAFQQAVWRELQSIPYGETLTYGELAERVGKPGSARAVGGAVGANPIPIIIPCHRVMGTSGAITGYSAGEGIPTKKALLDLEGISYRS